MPTARLPGDLVMYYEDDAFTDPWSKPETVILHHGNAKSSRLWYAWVPLLARDFRVIRVDARGFGRSSVPAPGYPWSLEGFATDLIHLMDHLRIDKAHLVGETIGGTIALQTVPISRQAAYRDRVHVALQVPGHPVLPGLLRHGEEARGRGVGTADGRPPAGAVPAAPAGGGVRGWGRDGLGTGA